MIRENAFYNGFVYFLPPLPMMDGHSGCWGCRIGGYVSLVVYAVITLITLYAAYNTHFLPDGSFIAGAPEGSLALLTVIFSFHMLMKAIKKACPCGGGCGCGSGCGCGGNCDCGGKPMMK